MDAVTHLGQVFTPPAIVQKMLALRRNHGRTLEPSAGEGAFSKCIPGCEAVEIDPAVAPHGAFVGDFFAYPQAQLFDTIIGNPPYVRYRDIAPATRARLDAAGFDKRSNLYLFFIEKCLRHLNPGGELIFIVPREFTKRTAARHLNQRLFAEGSITDFIETGDSSIFGRYTPNCAIFRFEKGRFDRRMHDGRTFACVQGQLLFLRAEYNTPLAAIFDVRVGAVSGADHIFTHPDGNAAFVCSTTRLDGQTRRMLYNTQHPHLLRHKERLLARRVRRFDDSNWWQWGRQHCLSTRPRVYVNARTRHAAPFFLHDCPNYDGAILALFARQAAPDLPRLVHLLNTAVDWQELGFVCDGRFLFNQRSLQQCPLPACFAPFAAGAQAP